MREVLFTDKNGLFSSKKIFACFLLSASVITVLTLISIFKAQGIFFPTDEFGYWSNAARILGIDLTGLTNAKNGYAPGYSTLLVPVMALIVSPVTMYRTALILNALILLLASVLFVRLITLIYDEPGIWILPCILFPSYLVYMSYTISEVLLYVLFLELCCVMHRISNGERSTWLTGFGMIMALLMVITHYRTAGILAVYVTVCFLVCFKSKLSEKRILIISVAVICLLLAAMIVYSNMGGRISRKIYDFGFIIDFLLGISGKIFYVCASTFGIGIIGLSEVVKRRKDSFFLFILLSFLYMIILSSFYFAGGTRLDQPVYGRYGEMFIPLLMYIGTDKMTKSRLAENVLIKILVFMGISTLFLTLFGHYNGRIEYVADFVNGIDWMFGTGMPKVSAVYITPFIITSLLLFVIDKALKTKKMRGICMASLTGVFVFIAVFLSWKHIWRFQDIDRSDRLLAEKAKAFSDDGREVIFLNSPYNDYINLLLFWCGNNNINVIEGLAPEAFKTSEDAVVITYINYECDYQLADRYDDHISSAHFEMYVSDDEDKHL